MSFIDSYKNMGCQRGGVLVFPFEKAIIIVDELENSHIDILGIDAFKIGPDWIQPFMEHSIDFGCKTNNWASARNFLSEKNKLDLVFELVVHNKNN